ncbi:MAG: 7-cyano-7-deazaguanine synthase [Chloroflexi bacterium]|jgi:7-cyano-7-deazaguanine synthase|nr:MAG: 7-cyano-7-deazaguanine synthase [Chloroflexota bacterium]
MSNYSHVLVVSGGMNSATLAHMCVKDGGSPYLITFDYGQKHRKEIEYARLLGENLGVPHQVVNISNIQKLLGGSALTDDGMEVPEGHYEVSNMSITVVPNRNAIFLTIAYAAVVSFESEYGGAAMHTGDHTIYPDCRPEFVNILGNMQKIATEGTGNPNLSIWTPFIDKSKAEFAPIGLAMGLDYGETWSCYKGDRLHCGRCGTCVEQKEVFELIGTLDPTQYQ